MKTNDIVTKMWNLGLESSHCRPGSNTYAYVALAYCFSVTLNDGNSCCACFSVRTIKSKL